jgi:hypothetical protein
MDETIRRSPPIAVLLSTLRAKTPAVEIETFYEGNQDRLSAHKQGGRNRQQEKGEDNELIDPDLSHEYLLAMSSKLCFKASNLHERSKSWKRRPC